MSDHSLPKSVDPLKYADQRKVLEGKVLVESLPRLAELLVEPTGQVSVKLEFGRDEQNLRILQGELGADLQLLCERCLAPVEKRIESQFTLGIVLDDEQAKNLPRSYEPLLVDPEKLELAEVIEEELILSLPMFAYHDDCEIAVKAETEDVPEENEKPNPFSVLSQLKLDK